MNTVKNSAATITDDTMHEQGRTAILGNEFISHVALATELGVSPRTLHRWEEKRIGPPRVVIGRLRLYRRSSVIEWLESREQKRRGVRNQ